MSRRRIKEIDDVISDIERDDCMKIIWRGGR